MGNAQKKAAQNSPKGSHASSEPLKKVHWDGPEGLPSPPGKPILMPGDEDSQPDVVAIRWERSSSNGSSTIIGYQVEHRKMGSPNWVRSAPILCTFPELMLSGLEPGWRYQFRIRAQNGLGLSEPSELSDPLSVTLQKTTSISPKFETELMDCIVLEGQQAKFSVVYVGIPTPKISWFKDGFEIFSSRRTTITTDSGKSILIIYKTLIDDEGEIKCSATNRAGHISTRAKLMIEAPPYVRIPRQYEDGLLFEQGETIRLKATNTGRPLPSVTWYHNSKIIINDQRHNFESITNNENILKIQNAKRQDRGEYSIRAVNKLGQDITSFLVTVTDRPGAPKKIIIKKILGRTVTLTWSEPDDDGGCQIGTYIVEYYRHGWDVWLKVATCKKRTTTLNDLIEGSEYQFRVKAENPYGLSDPSEESDIIFIPDSMRRLNRLIDPQIVKSSKSASYRDIPRGRSEKREVNYKKSSNRTRSLNREKISHHEAVRAYEWTNSSQQLLEEVNSSTVLLSDNRVTFAIHTINHGKNESDRQWSKKIPSQPEDIQIIDEVISHQTETVITPDFDDTGGQKSSMDLQSCLACLPHIPHLENQMTKGTSKIENKKDTEKCKSQTIPYPILQCRRNNSEMHDESMHIIQSEDEENMLHDSSEFMLLLYPEKQNNELYTARKMKRGSVSLQRISNPEKAFSEHRLNCKKPEYSEDEYLIPPLVSFSLPELFSTGHEIVNVIREAVSSTELLHERVMERVYRALEIEKSKKNTKETQIKLQVGRQRLSNARSDDDIYPLFNPRMRSVHNRLLNSENTPTMGLLKRDHRRLSDGQAKVPLINVPTVFNTAPLENTSSDQNLLISNEMLAQNLELTKGLANNDECLCKWPEPELDLSNEIFDTATMENKDKEKLLKSMALDFEEILRIEREYDEVAPDTGEILAEDSIETSGVSSEDESIDSEDLKQLKSRIITTPIDDDVDTYHPYDQIIMHVDLETPPPIPPHRVPLHDFLPPIPNKMNLSTTNLFQISSNLTLPKSILKKGKEIENMSMNKFGQIIPPEKPIRKSLPIYGDTSITSSNSKSMSNLEYSNDISTFERNIALNSPISVSTSIITSARITDTDLDEEAVISAGEAALIKRKQMRNTSKAIFSTEANEEQQEKLAVVNHYTELVQQYSNSEIRQHSLSCDREQKLFDSSFKSEFIPFAQTAQSNIYKKRLTRMMENIITPIPPVTLTKIVTPIPPVTLTKIVTPIPPVIPSISIQKANLINSTEQNSRFLNLTNKINLIETTEKSRKQKSECESTKIIKSNVESDLKNSISRSNNLLLKNESQLCSRNNLSICNYKNVSKHRESLVTVSPITIEEHESRHTNGIKVSNSTKTYQSSSRSNSKDRSQTNNSMELQMERSQRSLENNRSRLRKISTRSESRIKGRDSDDKNFILILKTERKVRQIISYVIDVILLLAAMYVYLFKKEILAVPIIGLLLYRYIKQEICDCIPSWWKHKN